MLSIYGWTSERQHAFARHAARGLHPARVIEQQRGLYRLISAQGELRATLSGKFAFEAERDETPIAGDWTAVAIHSAGTAVMHALLARTSFFARRSPSGERQAIAANIDVAFLVSSLNDELNARRLERLLALARDGGAKPVIVLTKADLCDDAERREAGTCAIAGGASVHVVSAVSGAGLGALAAYLAPGKTAALLGSSGVGKSTLVNALAGVDIMATQSISGDGRRGRHTTTHRALVLLPGGGLILDTPGLREVSVWGADAGVAQTFGEIEGLTRMCRFRDCAHASEPECAVRAALESGALDEARWRSYARLKRELAFDERREDPKAAASHRRMLVARVKKYRALKRHRERDDDG